MLCFGCEWVMIVSPYWSGELSLWGASLLCFLAYISFCYPQHFYFACVLCHLCFGQLLCLQHISPVLFSKLRFFVSLFFTCRIFVRCFACVSLIFVFTSLIFESPGNVEFAVKSCIYMFAALDHHTFLLNERELIVTQQIQAIVKWSTAITLKKWYNVMCLD